jgi:HEAT repeat protein
MKSLNNLMALFLMLIFLVIFGCAHKTPFNFKLPPKEQIPDEISKEVRHSIIGLYNYEPANSFQLNCEIAATELRNMGKKSKEAVPYLIIIARTQIKSFGSYGETRRMAIQALGEIGDERAVPALIEALKYPDQRIQAPAAEALGNIGDFRATLPLINAIQKADNRAIRGYASRAIGEIRDPQAVEPLIDLLSRRKDSLRGYIAMILGYLGDKRAVKPLLEMYREDQIKGNRKDALSALIKIKDERAVGLYIECINNAKDYRREVRHDAAKCILELDHPKAIAARREAQAVIDQTTPIYEIAYYDILGRLRKSILKNRKEEQIAHKYYLYHALSKILHSISIYTEVDGLVGIINFDPSGKPEKYKYLCLDRLGDVIYIDRKPAIIEVDRPISQFSRTYYEGENGKGKIRLIYPLEDPNIVSVNGCRYLW